MSMTLTDALRSHVRVQSTQHTKPSCFSFPLTNSFLMTDTVATPLLCPARYQSLASMSGAVPVQTELHVLPVINDDSFSKRRRAWRMGWSTAFNSKAFWLIYAFFSLLLLYQRGESCSYARPWHCLGKLPHWAQYGDTHRGIFRLVTGLQALAVMWISFSTSNCVSWSTARLLGVSKCN